jgi:hypothetical protein
VAVHHLPPLTGALVIVIVVSSWRSNRWDRQRAGLDLILDQRGADMADVPGGGSGLLARDCKGKKADRKVTCSDPGVVWLVAELRAHERQAAEELASGSTASGSAGPSTPRRRRSHVGQGPYVAPPVSVIQLHPRTGGKMATSSHAPTDAVIVAAARQLYSSVEMNEIRAAHQRGLPVTISIGRYSVQYEALPFSGFTSFGIDGFVIGKEAFASESELKKTLLHELYRLHHSELAKGRGVDRHTIRAETDAAFQFAERFWMMI